MKQVPLYRMFILSLSALAMAGPLGAQSTGGMSPSSSGSAAAGGSPVGMVLPWTVQTGSTAPTLPGHATTRVSSSKGPAEMPTRAEAATVAYHALDSTNRGYLSRSEVQALKGFSFEEADINQDGRLSEEEFAKAWNTKPSS